ncbi:MAG: SLBB domain-containing protein [Cyclobacteriaceae bacterium]
MRTFLLTLALVFTGLHSHAQVLSNNSRNSTLISQIVAAYAKAKQMGLTDEEIKYQMIKRGYTAQMFDQAKKLALSGMSSSAALTLPGGFALTEDSTAGPTPLRDTSWVFKTPMPKKPSKYFGYQYFNQAFANFSPNNSLATPKQYVLGPGDNLKILISGQNYREINEYINAEGKINIPYVGLIFLSGMTIESAETLLTTKLSALYPAIRTGLTKIDVALGEIRTIQIIVSGEAESPGSYVVSSLTSFFNLLNLCGGPSERGTLRNIQLIRNNKVIDTIDFYEFLTTGRISKEVRLEDQDNIFFPVYQNRVELTGEVKTASIFELKPNEKLADLLRFSGGFSEKAFKNSITIYRNEANSRVVSNVEQNAFERYALENGDRVEVGAINQLFTNRVVVSGEVKRPGVYGITSEEGLTALLRSAGGLTDRAFPNRGILHRTIPGRPMQTIQFNAEALLNGTQNEIPLLKNDSVVIFPADNFKPISFVTVNGSVKNPGKFPFQTGMTAEDLIAMAGGFTIDAAIHKVELSRLEKNNSDKLSNEVLMVRKIQVDSTLRINKASITLEPFDEVFVPRLLNYQLLGNVKVRGEILYEGDYGLEKRDQTVMELITRAGGISPYASLGDVQIYRNGLRIGSNKFRDSRRDINLKLLPGDSIYIPRKNQFVTINGQVYNEQIVEYKTSRLMYYISGVGGITSTGNPKKIYVQYPNGMYKKTERLLFFRSYPRIIPGSKIIVPEKAEIDRNRLQLAELTGIASLLTSLVAIFSLLQN